MSKRKERIAAIEALGLPESVMDSLIDIADEIDGSHADGTAALQARIAELTKERDEAWTNASDLRAEVQGLIVQFNDSRIELVAASSQRDAAERELESDRATIMAMREALEWAIGNDEAERDEVGLDTDPDNDTPMIAACRAAVALDAARRATTNDAPAPKVSE